LYPSPDFLAFLVHPEYLVNSPESLEAISAFFNAALTAGCKTVLVFSTVLTPLANFL
jgi:hypothetical protein